MVTNQMILSLHPNLLKQKLILYCLDLIFPIKVEGSSGAAIYPWSKNEKKFEQNMIWYENQGL